jgi:hypothetical protein
MPYIVYVRGTQIPPENRSQLEILGARSLTWSRFHSEAAPQIKDAMIQNLVARNLYTPAGLFIHTDGVKKCIHILRKEKTIKTVILNIYR